MKSKLFGLMKGSVVLLLSIFLLSSCEGPMGPQGPAGPSGYVNKEIIPFTVNKGDWQWDANNEFYYYDFDVKEITPAVIREGAVNGYVIINGTHILLNYTGHYYDSGNDLFYTESMSMQFAQGLVRFTIAASDLFDNTPDSYQPETQKFEVRIFW